MLSSRRCRRAGNSSSWNLHWGPTPEHRDSEAEQVEFRCPSWGLKCHFRSTSKPCFPTKSDGTRAV